MAELTQDERVRLTYGVMTMLDKWRLSATDIIKILALPKEVRPRNLGRFRDGEPFPDDPGVMKRIDYLVRITDALRTYFPRNPEMRDLWMRRGNRKFGSQAPLTVMVDEGESGMVHVLSFLDCTYAWDQTGSKTTYDRR